MLIMARALSLDNVRGNVRRNVRLPILVALVASLSPSFGQDASASRWEGRPISRIEFEPAEQPQPREELDRLLPLRPGNPLRIEDVRSAIQKLYSTGRYSDIAIEASADGASVALKITTDFSYFISGVNIEGEKEPPNRTQLITAAKMELGSRFIESDLDQAIANMQEKMRANGLYNATIQSRVDLRKDTEEANIYFELDSGFRAHFDGVELAGQLTRPKEAIIKATGWRRGFGFIPIPGWREVTENRVQAGIEKLRQDFQKGDRLEAKV